MPKKASSNTVSLHKDEHMRQAKTDWHQPHQLDLFKMLVSDQYSNSVELYQSLPDVYPWKQDKLRNPDGTLRVLTRQGKYHGTPYTLEISPANITITNPKTKEKSKRAFYKTVVAEFVEHALHKLSISDGFFISNQDNRTDEFGLITTFYQIREELKAMGKNYSYEQIREGVSILAGLRYELSGDISKEYSIDSFFSPIDLNIRNNRKNPHHSELYITFNKLISKKILALDWRSFNYAEFMKLKTSFWRTLFMRLSHRFQQADVHNGYHVLLSTLIEEGALQEDLITTNIKKINAALEDCQYIIDSYETEERYDTNPATKRRALVDYKITIYPTKDFQAEQWRLNAHNKNIKNHKLTNQWEPIIKPMRDQYGTRDYLDYSDDKEQFDALKN